VILRVFEGHMHFPQRKRVVQPTGLVVMHLWIEDGQLLAVDFAQEHAGDKKRGKRNTIFHTRNLINSEVTKGINSKWKLKRNGQQRLLYFVLVCIQCTYNVPGIPIHSIFGTNSNGMAICA